MLEKEKILLKYIELKQCHVYQLGIFFCLILMILLVLSIIELKLFIVLTSGLFIYIGEQIKYDQILKRKLLFK